MLCLSGLEGKNKALRLTSRANYQYGQQQLPTLNNYAHQSELHMSSFMRPIRAIRPIPWPMSAPQPKSYMKAVLAAGGGEQRGSIPL